uniref:Uncharacterized protein n=1 Tax=Strombidium inclinatum TaxID=197538 RepID=A0A7S3J1B5_9SPIT|mmetsp:Transcript_9266/g.14033  ORF Transcript_9266/g.14033 Transcript_9266/m.14033 type:complete len:120 (+) Transcript_9266:196-555(+)
MKGDISDIIDGIKLIGQALVTLPEDMVDCQYTDDDLRRLSEWAQIFTDPKKLSEVVAKNMVLHGKKIHEDMNAIPEDMGAGDYYKAGEDVADLVVLALGKVPDNSTAPTGVEGLEFTQW